ncbi:MAG: hypothetical protein RLZZ373_3184 [Pseudomonadota bacterium]|jgi:hypothetical protein
MAEEKNPASVNTPAKAVAEAKRRAVADRDQRLAAGKGAGSQILAPADIGGKYDSGRQLETTLGGVRRAVTNDDLTRYAASVKRLGSKFRGGITAREVINLATPDRRQRASSQIHHAVPLESRGARLHVTTNAAPGSKALRHHIHLEFLDMSAATASPKPVTALAKLVAEGGLKFDCDCPDHRYRYRFITTAGGFNAGRPETGYPKLTNPELTGVACKHALRVMQSLTRPSALHRKIAQMIEHERERLESGDKAKAVRVTKAEAEAIAKDQAKEIGWKRSAVESTAERNTRLAQQRAMKAASAAPAARGGGSPHSTVTQAQKAAMVLDLKKRVGKMLAAGIITQKQATAMLKNVP